MLQLTQLSGYKVLFMMELLVAEAIFCHKLRRRPWFWLRLSACVAGCLAVSVLYPLGPYTVVSNSVLFFTLFFGSLQQRRGFRAAGKIPGGADKGYGRGCQSCFRGRCGGDETAG